MPHATTNYPLNDYYSRIHKRYDLANRLFTFGRDQKWRRVTALRCMEFNPAKVMDLCCGTGDLAIAVKKLARDQAEVVGLDFNASMLELARKKATEAGFGSIEFLQGDAASIPFSDGSFDCMTIGFGIRNLLFQNDRSYRYLFEIQRVIKTDGFLLILESSIPKPPLIRFFHKLFLKFILIPLGGILSGNWKAYRYLSRSSLNFFNLNDLEKLLNENRLRITATQKFLLGAANLIVAKKE